MSDTYRNINKSAEQREIDEMIEVRAVAELLRKGKSRAKIVEHLMAETGMSKSTAYKRLNAALKWIALDDPELIDNARARTTEQIDELLEKAIEKEDIGNALRAIELRSKIEGLQNQKVEVQAPADQTITFTIS